jgi:hypothetical protein
VRGLQACGGRIRKERMVDVTWDRKERLRVDGCPERVELVP